jgi:hypothetical protein
MRTEWRSKRQKEQEKADAMRLWAATLLLIAIAMLYAVGAADLPADKVDADKLYQAAHKRAGEVTNGQK